MPRVFNFGGGPAVLPEAVLSRARDELADWRGHGLSVMEMSHRGPEFAEIAGQAEADLRDLMRIPASYRVLFLHGGATAQFAGIPMNLAADGGAADYVVTGFWSERARAEAGQYLSETRLAASSAPRTYAPPPAQWSLSPDAAYVHVTLNETIDGVALGELADPGPVPLVADASSFILSEPIDVRAIGVLYASGQKNLGIAGITVVIVREDLLGRGRPAIPSVLNWTAQARAGSMLNTPSTYSWYMTGLVLGWLREQGGVPAIAEVNRRKAAALYAAIDESGLFSNPVQPPYRSRMNVPFRLAEPALETAFLEQARAAGLINLEGHRSVGGMRASIYNAMPEAGVSALIAVMKEFEREHG